MADAVVGTLRAILSADTAQFSAAMATAGADVKELAEKLQKDLEPRQRAVNAAVKDFLGTDEIRRAEEYAAAVKRIGDVSLLSEADQRKVNKAVTDGLAVYQRMGEDAPEHLKKLKADTDQVTSAWDRANETLGKFGLSLSGLGLASVTGLVLALGKSAFEAADKFSNLSAATGLTLGELQRLDFAGAQVGTTIETTASAVQRLQRELVENKGGAADAMAKLGLNVDALLKMSPGAMFETMAASFAKLPTAAEKSAVGLQLFGKSWGELAPLVLGDIKKLEDGYSGMSDRSIENLDRLGDWWEGFYKRQGASVGELIGYATDWGFAWDQVITGRIGLGNEYVDQVEKEINKSRELLAEVVASIPQTGAWAENTTALAKAHKANAEALEQGLKDQKERDAQTAKSIKATEDHAAEMKELTARLKEGAQQAFVLYHLQENAIPTLTGVKVGTQLLSKELKAQSSDLNTLVVPAWITFNDKMVDLVELAKVGVGKDSIDAIKNLGTEVKLMPAPPIDKWRQFKDDAVQTLNNLEFDVAQTTVKLIGHWSHWKDVTAEIWGQVQGAFSRILGDLLYEFEHKFIQGMITAIVGAKLGETIGASLMGASSAGTAASAAGSGSYYAALGKVAGSAWGEYFAVAAIEVLIAYGIYKAFFNNGPGDKHVSPGASTGYDPGENRNAGGGSGSDSGSTDASVSMPNVPAMAGGGMVLPSPGGTIVRLAEGGYPEIVTPVVPGSGGQMLKAQIYIGARQVAEAIVPVWPDAVASYGVGR